MLLKNVIMYVYMCVKQELQFRKLNAVKDDVQIGVIRAGVSTSIDVKEVVHTIIHL